jgi:hypothetical protein
MYLGPAKFTTLQSHCSYALELAPTPFAKLFSQTDVISDSATDRDGLDLLDFADDLEKHGSLSLRTAVGNE